MSTARTGPVLVASDLDRTLIYSATAMTLGEPSADPVCVEIFEGEPISFMSASAVAELAELSRTAVFVPVTTRTQAQYSRIRIPGVEARHAVTTNGAVILDEGRPCPRWEAQVAANLAGDASFPQASAALAPVLDRPWVRKIRDAEQRFVYAVFEPAEVDPAWYAELAAVAEELGWVVSVQGRKAYAIPRGLTKEAALAELVRRTGATTVLAAGDSLLDRGILGFADRAIRPAHGELHEQGWAPHGLSVTRHAGVRAGEEIVSWLSGSTTVTRNTDL